MTTQDNTKTNFFLAPLHQGTTSLWRDLWDDNMFGLDFFQGIKRRALPALNIKETDKTYEISLAAAGKKKEDFNIEVADDVLKISYESDRKNEDKDNEGYLHREFDNYWSAQRLVRLAKDVVDTSKIKAEYKDGVLAIALPKQAAKHKTTRRINIG